MLLALGFILLPSFAHAAGGSEWYFSWGYNRDFYAPSDIHISQPSLGNDFTIHHVKALDYAQWNSGGGIGGNDLTVPQFNLRFGWFLEHQHEWAVEFSLDHTKYSSTLNQTARVTGTINGQPVDQYSTLTPAFFNYRLHNGANPIMLSLVKRTPLVGAINQSGTLSLLLKAGAGIMLPHAESTIMGGDSDVGPKTFKNSVGISNGWWQLNGWVTGAEAAVRLVTVRPIFIELSDKVAYSHIWNVPVYQGRADQSIWMNEVLFAVGVTMNDSNEEDHHSDGP
jgi:hypothetical protein